MGSGRYIGAYGPAETLRGLAGPLSLRKLVFYQAVFRPVLPRPKALNIRIGRADLRHPVGSARRRRRPRCARLICNPARRFWLGHPSVSQSRRACGHDTPAAAVAKSRPGRSTTLLLIDHATHGIGPHLYGATGPHPVKDFAPIILVASCPCHAVQRRSPAACPQEVSRFREGCGRARSPSRVAGNGVRAAPGRRACSSLTGPTLLHVALSRQRPPWSDAVRLTRRDQVSMRRPLAYAVHHGGKLRGWAAAAPSVIVSCPTFQASPSFGTSLGNDIALVRHRGLPARRPAGRSCTAEYRPP